MTLEAAYFISQILAAVGIIGSLIFVGIQMRQTRDAQLQQAEESRFQAMSHLMGEYRSILRLSVADEKLGRAYLVSAKKGMADLEPLDRTRLLAFIALTLRTHEQAFLHHQGNRLDTAAWEAFSGMMRANISHRVQAEYFELRKQIFSKDFVEYYEHLSAEKEDLNSALFG